MARPISTYINPALRCLGHCSPSPMSKMPRTKAIREPFSPMAISHSSILSQTSTREDAANVATEQNVTPVEDVFDPHFLVISLGNPPPYADCLHSAGHIALQALQQQLQRDAAHAQPAFSSERVGKKATKTSRGPKYTLLQSPTLMNVSGPWVAKAWREVLAETGGGGGGRPLGLVVVHDDLEEDVAVVKIRRWERSHRGHNGLKSIMASLRPDDFRDSRWAKVSVGIGRPEGRDHGTVSDYVLKPMSKHQRAVLSEKSASPVLEALEEIEAAWGKQRETGATDEPEKAAKAKPPRMRVAKKGEKAASQEAAKDV